MICDTICGYCRKEVKSVHDIEAVHIYFNRSSILGGENLTVKGLRSLVTLRITWRILKIKFNKNKICAAELFVSIFHSFKAGIADAISSLK